jgi:uncharacterized membrane protein
MPSPCPSCGAPVLAGSDSCLNCGTAAPAFTEAPAYARRLTAPVDLRDRILGAIAYLSIVPALILLALDRFRNNRFVRFHAFQCLLLCAATVVVAGLVWFLAAVALLAGGLLGIILAIGLGILWLVVMLKALLGEQFKVLLIGNYAERLADSPLASSSGRRFA